MSKSETEAHLHLKKLAMDWIRGQGFRACAQEVRIPKSGYRADVMGYHRWSPELQAIDVLPDSSESGASSFSFSDADGAFQPGFTAILECKQSRSDFLRDEGEWEELQSRVETLKKRRLVLERLIRTHHEEWTLKESLFSEMDPIALDRVQHPTYLKVLRQLATLSKRKKKESKFDCLSRYEVANLLYLVVEPGLILPRETPSGWGLLERQANGELELRCRPRWRNATPQSRLAALESIARRASRVQKSGDL